MSNYSKNIQTQFKKLKTSVSDLITQDKNEETRPIIELDPRTYEMIKKIAGEQKVSVEMVYSQAIELYISRWTDQSSSPITEEQKDNNPLLHLENLTKRI